MNNTANKKDIFYIIVLILTFITVVVGATFALYVYFHQDEEGASAVYTGTFQIDYLSGDKINFYDLTPREKPTIDDKENVYKNNFKVTNTGSLNGEATIYIDINENDFELDDTLKYALYKKKKVEKNEYTEEKNKYSKEIIEDFKDLIPTMRIGDEITSNSVYLYANIEGYESEKETETPFCNFYRSTSLDGKFELVTDWQIPCLGDIGILDENLKSGTTYYYKAKVVGGNNYSEVVSVTTLKENNENNDNKENSEDFEEIIEGYIDNNSKEVTIASNLEFNSNKTEEYTLLIWIEENGEDQSKDMKKNLRGRIRVYAIQDKD